MKRTAVIDVIAGNKMLNEIMGMADMRDSYKVFAELKRYKITFVGSGDNLANDMRQMQEFAGDKVVLSYVREIDGVKLETPDYYLKQGVSQISDGKKVSMLKDMLQALGYTVEVDEHNRVVKLL